MRKLSPSHKFLKRPCKKCNKLFRPVSKHNLICPICIEEAHQKRWGKKMRKK